MRYLFLKQAHLDVVLPTSKICGRIHDRSSAELALRDADFALSGKSFLLNPDWVDDVRSGKEMECFSSDDANVSYTDTPFP